MRLRRVAAIAAVVILVFSVAFGFYLWKLYGQLNSAFTHENQFIPTRVYSDVTRIAPPQPLPLVQERLKSLGYSYQIDDEGTLRFTLRTVDYPVYLVPQGHPVLEAGNQPVALHFEGSDPDHRLLRSIELGGKEVADLFLEPELVATLSRAGVTGIRTLVKFNDIPARIWQAIIAVEDPRFLEHKGIDPRGLARAIWVDLRRRSRAQGGSTITLQLVKNLMARHNKNLVRKANELFLAVLLELAYDKEEDPRALPERGEPGPDRQS